MTEGPGASLGVRPIRPTTVTELRFPLRWDLALNVSELTPRVAWPLGDLPEDAMVVTYCTVGYRSGKAAVELEKRLGRPVYNLDGGILAWFNQGGEVLDPGGRPVDKIDAWGEPKSSV